MVEVVDDRKLNQLQQFCDLDEILRSTEDAGEDSDARINAGILPPVDPKHVRRGDPKITQRVGDECRFASAGRTRHGDVLAGGLKRRADVHVIARRYKSYLRIRCLIKHLLK